MGLVDVGALHQEGAQVRTREQLAAAHAADPEQRALIDPNSMQMLPYFSDFGIGQEGSRQWVLKSRDLAGAEIERRRAELEDQLVDLRRQERDLEEQELEEERPKGEITADKIAVRKEIAQMQRRIAVETERVEQRQAEFRKQLDAALGELLAEEGSEIRDASWNGARDFSLTLAVLHAPDAESLQQVQDRLERRESVQEASVERVTADSQTAVHVRVSYVAPPQPLATLGVSGPIVDRLRSLLSDPDSDAGRGRLAAAVNFADRAVEALAGAGVAVDRPFASSQHFSPLVGDQMKWRALWAMLVAVLGILAYIAARFEFRYGIGAIIALVHDVMITVGLLAVFDIRIDLTVVAALLTIIGYSLNDTIVVFDRIRENIRKLESGLAEIIDLSIAQTMSRTVLTSTTTLVVVLILFLFGGEGVRAFSATLLIGLVLGTYSSVFVAAPTLLALSRGKPTKALIAEASAPADPNDLPTDGAGGEEDRGGG